MQKLTTFFLKIFVAEKDNLWLWVPVLFGFGAAFYFAFEGNFLLNFVVLAALFSTAVLFYFLNRHSIRSLIFLGCSLFLLGSFYAHFYQKIFISSAQVTGKIYVDGVGKVASVRKFLNPVNGVEGASLVISEPVLYKSKFLEKKEKKHKKSKKKVKKKKIKKKKTEKKKMVRKPRNGPSRTKSSGTTERSVVTSGESGVVTEGGGINEVTTNEGEVVVEAKEVVGEGDQAVIDADGVAAAPNSRLTLDCHPVTDCYPELVSGSADKLDEAVKSKKLQKKKAKKKPKKPKKISAKTIQKNFVNLPDYQEIDREFLDYSKNYQQVAWQEIQGRERFPSPPQKISINLIKNFQNIAVNDVVAVRMMLQPAKAKEFPDDFDAILDAKFKKIGAYGYALGEAKILQKAEISSADGWFLSVREKIRSRILGVLKGDQAAIALAFLIGDQNQISQDLMEKIRNSGLAHLLSISGFHLSLASAICFVATRFILSRSEYLTLRFDLKKIAALAAIFGTYFYLKIADSPLPAQRAFLMVLLVLIALFVGEKINAKRAVMTGALALILLNPYAVFNISFQLSFAAILVLCSFVDYKNRDRNSYFLWRFLGYFFEIILISIAIQIATTPFLMRSFQNVTLLGFVANVLAIPLTSFFVMPLGFLAIFLMPLNLEKYALLLMERGIFLIEKIAIFVTDLNFSHFVSPHLSSLGLVVAILGLLLICLSKSHLRLVGIFLFCLSFLTIFFVKKPDILFDIKQKFFALNVEDGLVFSKDLRPSKKRRAWMKKMGEAEFKSLTTHPQKDIFCDEVKCVIEKNQKILVLLKRNKISEICRNDFDVIVNLTAKYKLPSCIAENKIKIDNLDFYQKGGQFFYLEGE